MVEDKSPHPIEKQWPLYTQIPRLGHRPWAELHPML